MLRFILISLNLSIQLIFIFILSPEDMVIDFRERGGEGERHQSVASCMCTAWGPNLQPFGLRDNVSTEGSALARAEPKLLPLENGRVRPDDA